MCKSVREYRKSVFHLVKMLSEEEKFNLISQMRRAATSVTYNIAEGHGRYHYQENMQFLRQSRGSLEELLDDINICLDENYCASIDLEQLKTEGFDLIHRINGYVVYLRKMKQVEKAVESN